METNFKKKTYRNPKYLDFLREQACMVCGRTPQFGERNTAAHLSTATQGLKGTDQLCVPLCAKCHLVQEFYKGEEFKKQIFKILGFEAKEPTLEDAEWYFNRFLESD